MTGISRTIRKLALIGAAVAVAFSVVAAPAGAQSELSSEWLLCSNENKAYTPDIVADGCTAVIRSSTSGSR